MAGWTGELIFRGHCEGEEEGVDETEVKNEGEEEV